MSRLDHDSFDDNLKGPQSTYGAIETENQERDTSLPLPVTVETSQHEEILKWSTKKSLGIWLLICYSVCVFNSSVYLHY